METDYQKVYNNLTTLLQDICQFLSSDKMGFLSHRDKKLVESLITRAKVQLQEISKIEKLSATEEYVDMDSNKGPTEEEDDKKIEIYSSADDVNRNLVNVFKESVSYIGDVNKNPGNIIQIPCPYIDIPARNASQNVKYGFISMKKKFLLFEKQRRVYAAIHNNWLLIYYTEKDNKPHCTFFLKHYEAKEAEGHTSTSFELISTFDRKTYFASLQFTALTHKDMVQWVVNINRCHDKVIMQDKDLGQDDSFSLEEDDGEHYDFITPGTENPNDDKDEEDDIYLELDVSVLPSKNTKNTPQIGTEDNTGPPLPRRPPSMSIKALTPVYGSDSSLTQNVDDASIEENSDETYDIFVNVKENIKKMSTALPINTKENEDLDNRSKDESERDKIKIYQSNSPTIQKNVTGLEKEFRNKSKSFIHEINKKSNSLLKPIKENKENSSLTSKAEEFKSGGGDMIKHDQHGAASDDDGDETYMFVNVKQKITKMSMTLPKHDKENKKAKSVPNKIETEEGFRSKVHSFSHDVTKHSNSPLKVPLDSESTTNRIVNKDYSSPMSESKEFKYDTNDTIKQSDQNVEGTSSEDSDDIYMFVNVKQNITKKMSTPLPKIHKESEKPNALHEEKITISEHSENMSIKDKIGKYHGNKSHSIAHEITKKFNSPLKIPVGTESTTDLKANEEHRSSTSESKDLKCGAIDMDKSPASASKKFKVDTETGTNDLKSDLKDFETDTNADDPKFCKWSGGLHPPVIKKVPTVPLKPKIRDKPFIGKRPLYGGFRQVTDDQ